MAEPQISALGERIYDEIRPIAVGDEERDWVLKRFVEAWCLPLVPLDEIVSDDPDTGAPGWSKIMNPDTAPVEWLPWLAQFIGYKLRAGASEAENRSAIKNAVGLRRGSPASIRAVVEPLLTGTKYILFTERYQGSAWKLLVVTLTAETPDAAAVEKAIISQKPAGIVLTYQSIAATTYNAIGAYADYNALAADYTDYNSIPGTPPSP